MVICGKETGNLQKSVDPSDLITERSTGFYWYPTTRFRLGFSDVFPAAPRRLPEDGRRTTPFNFENFFFDFEFFDIEVGPDHLIYSNEPYTQIREEPLVRQPFHIQNGPLRTDANAVGRVPTMDLGTLDSLIMNMFRNLDHFRAASKSSSLQQTPHPRDGWMRMNQAIVNDSAVRRR